MSQVDPDADTSLRDEDYLSKQLEAQVGLKKKLIVKFENAKKANDQAQKKKAEKIAADKIEAYNAWRAAEDKRGRTQDEHGRNLVKTMLERVKSVTPKEPVTESMCYVMGNVDGKLI